MPDLDDVSRLAARLPGNEQRTTTGGLAWFVRNKLYAWECYPWPSSSDAVKELLKTEVLLGVKVNDEDEERALVQGWPDIFVDPDTAWGRPKVVVRLGRIDPDHLGELVTEAWYTRAPKYLRREFDGEDVG